MRQELRRRFPGWGIGGTGEPDHPPDLLTGVFGSTFIAALFGIPVLYSSGDWPNTAKEYRSDEQVDAITKPEINNTEIFQNLMAQLDRIEEQEGEIRGYVNWQGVLNNAYRLRGDRLFLDLRRNPQRARNLFRIVFETMVDVISRVRSRQASSGVDIPFVTVSNCLVNMISPDHYQEFLYHYDQQFAERFGCIAVHNCAWNADPYLDQYSRLPNVGYIDMGMETTLSRAKQLFPHARRALMYTPMDLSGNSLPEIQSDFETIAHELGPCDLVIADIDTDTPDERIHEALELCGEINERFG